MQELEELWRGRGWLVDCLARVPASPNGTRVTDMSFDQTYSYIIWLFSSMLSMVILVLGTRHRTLEIQCFLYTMHSISSAVV